MMMIMMIAVRVILTFAKLLLDCHFTYVFECCLRKVMNDISVSVKHFDIYYGYSLRIMVRGMISIISVAILLFKTF